MQVWAETDTLQVGGVSMHVVVGRSSRAELSHCPEPALAEDLGFLQACLRCCCSIGVWLLAEIGIRRQISRIAKDGRPAGRGRFAARVPSAPTPSGELGRLITVLNRTADSA